MPRLNVTHSEAVAAILSRPPHWLLRSGMAIMAGGMALIVVFAALFQYPDVVRGTATITSLSPPVPLTHAGGQLDAIFAQEGDSAQTGQILALFSADLPLETLKSLQMWVDAASRALADGKEPLPPPRPSIQLGSLQATYSQAVAAWEMRQRQESLSLPVQGMAATRQRLQLLTARKQRLDGQVSLLQEKLRIATARFQADSMLESIGSASVQEVETSREGMLTALEALAVAEAAVVDRDLLAAATTQDLERYAIESGQSSGDSQVLLWQAVEDLRAAIAAWEERHLLRAPFPGSLSFDHVPAIGQYWGQGQTFAWLVPREPGPRLARVRIASQGAGKVELGQTVLLSLADYPEAEFGTVKGSVSRIAPLAREGHYHVEVNLPAVISSSRGIPLTVRKESIAQATIVTRKRSLLSRVFSTIASALE